MPSVLCDCFFLVSFDWKWKEKDYRSGHRGRFFYILVYDESWLLTHWLSWLSNKGFREAGRKENKSSSIMIWNAIFANFRYFIKYYFLLFSIFYCLCSNVSNESGFSFFVISAFHSDSFIFPSHLQLHLTGSLSENARILTFFVLFFRFIYFYFNGKSFSLL